MGGFLAGFSGAIGEKLEKQHEQAEQQKKQRREDLLKILMSGQLSDVSQAAMQREYDKLSDPETKKKLQNLWPMLGKLKGVIGGQQGQRQPTPGNAVQAPPQANPSAPAQTQGAPAAAQKIATPPFVENGTVPPVNGLPSPPPAGLPGYDTRFKRQQEAQKFQTDEQIRLEQEKDLGKSEQERIKADAKYEAAKELADSRKELEGEKFRHAKELKDVNVRHAKELQDQKERDRVELENAKESNREKKDKYDSTLPKRGKAANAVHGLPGPSSGAPTAGSPQDLALKKQASADPSMDVAAWDWLTRGTFDVRGIGGKATEQAEVIKRRAGQIMNDLGLNAGDVLALKTEYKGETAAFAKISSYAATIETFEDTLRRNAIIAKDLSDKFQRGDVQLYNRVLAAFKTGKGDPEANNLAGQLHGLAAEWAKVVAGSTGARGAGEQDIKSAEARLTVGMSNGQLSSFIDNVIAKDAQSRSQANETKKQQLLTKIRGLTIPKVKIPIPEHSITAPPNKVVDDLIKQYGKQ